MEHEHGHTRPARPTVMVGGGEYSRDATGILGKFRHGLNDSKVLAPCSQLKNSAVEQKLDRRYSYHSLNRQIDDLPLATEPDAALNPWFRKAAGPLPA